MRPCPIRDHLQSAGRSPTLQNGYLVLPQTASLCHIPTLFHLRRLYLPIRVVPAGAKPRDSNFGFERPASDAVAPFKSQPYPHPFPFLHDRYPPLKLLIWTSGERRRVYASQPHFHCLPHPSEFARPFHLQGRSPAPQTSDLNVRRAALLPSSPLAHRFCMPGHSPAIKLDIWCSRGRRLSPPALPANTSSFNLTFGVLANAYHLRSFLTCMPLRVLTSSHLASTVSVSEFSVAGRSPAYQIVYSTFPWAGATPRTSNSIFGIPPSGDWALFRDLHRGTFLIRLTIVLHVNDSSSLYCIHLNVRVTSEAPHFKFQI